MRVLLVCLMLLLTACAGWKPTPDNRTRDWTMRDIATPPPYPTDVVSRDDPRYQAWVTDVNAYAYYVFVYARNLNAYGKARGWHPPQIAPICEKLDIWDIHPIPERITLSETSRHPDEVTKDLAVQLKKLLTNYREDRRAFQRAYSDHLESCIY